MTNDWSKIEDVDKLAREKGVSWDLSFQESCGSYYFFIGSPATSECWVGKSRSFTIAVSDVIEWLTSI